MSTNSSYKNAYQSLIKDPYGGRSLLKMNLIWVMVTASCLAGTSGKELWSIINQTTNDKCKTIVSACEAECTCLVPGSRSCKVKNIWKFPLINGIRRSAGKDSANLKHPSNHPSRPQARWKFRQQVNTNLVYQRWIVSTRSFSTLEV